MVISLPSRARLLGLVVLAWSGACSACAPRTLFTPGRGAGVASTPEASNQAAPSAEATAPPGAAPADAGAPSPGVSQAPASSEAGCRPALFPPAAPWRVATPADFHPVVAQLGFDEPPCGVAQIDLDRDGRLDEARLEVNASDGRVRLQLTLAARPTAPLAGPPVGQASAGTPTRVMTRIWPRPAADLLRDYASPEMKRAAAAHNALVVCQDPNAEQAPNGVIGPDDSLNCYCEDMLVWTGELAVFKVCD